MRFKTVVALLFLTGLSYLAFQFIQIRRHGSDKPLYLFRTPLPELEWMELGFSDGKELSFYKEKGSWWVTDGRRGRQLPTDSIEIALRNIWSAIPDTVFSGWEEWGAVYPGYLRPEAVRVHFRQGSGIKEAFWLFRLDSFPEKAWIQFSAQSEIFEMRGKPWQLISRPLSDYSMGQLVQRSIAVYPDSLLYLVPADSIRVFLRFREGRWWRDGIPLTGADSLQWTRYLNRMASLELQTYAENFDETAPLTEIARRLILWRKKDRQVISCFTGSSSAEQLVIHTSSRPGVYFRTDSGALFRDLFLDMDSIILGAENTNAQKLWK